MRKVSLEEPEQVALPDPREKPEFQEQPVVVVYLEFQECPGQKEQEEAVGILEREVEGEAVEHPVSLDRLVRKELVVFKELQDSRAPVERVELLEHPVQMALPELQEGPVLQVHPVA